jgi:hypothetical protein
VDSLVWRQESECITTDIAEYSGVRKLLEHLVQRGIYIAVSTTLTQCGWTWGNILAWSIALAALYAKCLLQEVGIQLACTRQLAC